MMAETKTYKPSVDYYFLISLNALDVKKDSAGFMLCFKDHNLNINTNKKNF